MEQKPPHIFSKLYFEAFPTLMHSSIASPAVQNLPSPDYLQKCTCLMLIKTVSFMSMNYKVQRRNRKCVCVCSIYIANMTLVFIGILSPTLAILKHLKGQTKHSVAASVLCLVFLICEETYLQDTKPVAEINDLITVRTRQCHSIIIIIKKVPNQAGGFILSSNLFYNYPQVDSMVYFQKMP